MDPVEFADYQARMRTMLAQSHFFTVQRSATTLTRDEAAHGQAHASQEGLPYDPPPPFPGR